MDVGFRPHPFFGKGEASLPSRPVEKLTRKGSPYWLTG